jgi:hypothetical protein
MAFACWSTSILAAESNSGSPSSKGQQPETGVTNLSSSTIRMTRFIMFHRAGRKFVQLLSSVRQSIVEGYLFFPLSVVQDPLVAKIGRALAACAGATLRIGPEMPKEPDSALAP